MWHRHAIASRRLASALAAAIVLLAGGTGSALADAPYCSLRDPGHQIYDMYPTATGYRSVVREINNETQIAVGRQIPFPLMQGELGQHTLYVPVEDGSPLGYIQIRSELTEWGMAEIVWALNVELEVVDFRFQRCRGRACDAVLEKGLRELIQGLDQTELIELLDGDGELHSSLLAELSEEERLLASVATRSAVKVIAVIESGWSNTVQELARNNSVP
ncbi:MAG: hypothetical protein QNI99_18115 [Woeseiaceae bacterium]|nr:hypothetical protein [Woeseiaceae bacterium]